MLETSAIKAHTLTDFLTKTLPEKEPLIEGLLHRRDLVALGARRRNGKTTFLLNLAIAGASGAKSFIGYPIPKPFSTLLFMLEDDPAELQEKLKQMTLDRDVTKGVWPITRDDFMAWGVPINSENKGFRDIVQGLVAEQKPDAIFFDNLSHLVGADYNDPERIHSLIRFYYGLAQIANAPVGTAAHPRKEDKNSPCDLWQEPELWAEQLMGSSHFINSTGSIWLLEKRDECSLFVGGRQRGNGEWNRIWLDLDDQERFQVSDNPKRQLDAVLNTPTRSQAWDLLPPKFRYSEGETAVKAKMKSASTFHHWITQCVQGGVLKREGDLYCKAV
jgi:hypothetical protein